MPRVVVGVELGAKGEQQRLVVRERHPVRLPRVPLHLRQQSVLVLTTSLEAAIASEHLLHDPSRRNVEKPL
jgi:hypothetical protein